MVREILEIETEGSSIDEAVEKSLEKFGCSRAEIDVDILEVPSSGFFGWFGVKPAKIRVRLNDRACIAKEITRHLLNLCGFSVEVAISRIRRQIEIEIKSEESKFIIGRHGQNLNTLEFLVNSLADRVVEDRKAIVLDIDGYRARRAGFLNKLAHELSTKVRRSGRSTATPPLSTEERRLVIKFLKKEKGIEVKAAGSGKEGKLIISCRRN